MEHNYSIKNGQLILNNSRKNRILLHCFKFYQLLLKLGAIVSLLISMYVTFIIFKKCIDTETLNDCISLGAVFATFGSSVISVCSLYCNNQLTLFEDNLNTLRTQIPALHTWQRWPFVKRYSKEKISFKEKKYYTLINPLITFTSEERNLTIPVPSCTLDFKDISIIISFVKMLCFRKHYTQSIFNCRNVECQTDLFLFNCLLMIYKNIIQYKIGRVLMIVGGEFVFTSIIFSFFFRYFNHLCS